MRRHPDAIVMAHVMDPARRDLYVEGPRDKAFLEWLVCGRPDHNCQVIGIDLVDVPGVAEGGNRERLLLFLRRIEKTPARIRGFVDSDQDRLLGITGFPGNCWTTDHRDLESYVISEANIDSVIRAGCGLEKPSASALYRSATVSARFIAAIRLYSSRSSLRLPVSSGAWTKYVSCSREGAISVDQSGVLRSLLQSAGLGLTSLASTTRGVAEMEVELASVNDRDLIHGKDFMAIMTKQLSALGVRVDSASRLIFATFDRSLLSSFASLTAVGAYLSGVQGPQLGMLDSEPGVESAAFL